MKTRVTKSGYKIIQVLSGRSNVFLLTDSKCNILIDTSPGRRWKKLVKRLKQLNIECLDFLILTHTHYDHAANAFRIKEKYNARLIVSSREECFIEHGINNTPGGINAFTHFMVSYLGSKIAPWFNYDPCKPDILVDSVFTFNEYGINAFLMHTPGHSAGSMSLIIDDEVAVVGDAMFGVFRWSVFPPFADDPEEMVRSWGKLLETDCCVFLPAHGTEKPRLELQKGYEKRKK